MATGANAQYWQDARLPGVLKHDLLSKYLPVFLIRTGSVGKRTAYIDGFAGRGTYDNGQLGSAGLMLEFAAGQRHGPSRNLVTLYLCERDPESFAALDALADTYRHRQVDVRTRRDDVRNYLSDALTDAAGLPTFIFLDPCGVGIPFTDLVAGMNRGGNKPWPPTESMINFSLEALRRIAGHLTSENGSETTLAKLDVSLGGNWWREYFRDGVTDAAVNAVVHQFAVNLGHATGAHVADIPVKRAPSHRPIYHLIFTTRHTGGLWHFSNCAARATEKWWEAVRQGEEDTTGQFTIFDPTPTLAGTEAQALPVIAENIAALVADHGQIRLGDYPKQVFGDYFGRVRETVARGAVKRLHSEGRTPSLGTKDKPENLRVAPALDSGA